MATREVQMLQQMLDPEKPDPTGQQDDRSTIPKAQITPETLNETNPGSQVTQEEMELTSDMKNQVPVVNRAREQNRMSGISNFLSNPKIQNMMLQFAKAFAQGDKSQPGYIMAEAGEDNLSNVANQRAMEAYERGEDPAQAAGQFADPELVTRLQQQQMQQDQFEEEMKIAEEKVDLGYADMQSDTAYKFAKLSQDKQLSQRQLRLKENQKELETRLNKARIGLIQARTKAAQAEGQVDSARLAEASTQYLTSLQEMERNLSSQVETAQNIKEEAMRTWDNWRTNESWIRKQSRRTGIDLSEATTDEEFQEKIDTYIDGIQRQLNQIRTEKENIREGQSQRLGSGGGGGQQGGGGDEGDSGPSPRGTREEPVDAGNSMNELESLPPGSYGKLWGDTYYVGEGGETRLLTEEEEE